MIVNLKKNSKMKIIRFYFGITIISTTIMYSCLRSKETVNLDCKFSINQLLQDDSSRLQINDRTNDGIVTQLVDKTKDSVTTGAYYFYPNGSLKSYKFFSLPSTYQYNEEYDSMGNITLIEGSPLVLRLYNQIDSLSVQFTFLFSTLHKEIKNVKIKTNTGVQFPAELLSNATFTNMKSVTFNLPVAKTFKSTVIYTEAQLFNNCLQKSWLLKDTAKFEDKSLYN